jgi:hypothetical protein
MGSTFWRLDVSGVVGGEHLSSGDLPLQFASLDKVKNRRIEDAV